MAPLFRLLNVRSFVLVVWCHASSTTVLASLVFSTLFLQIVPHVWAMDHVTFTDKQNRIQSKTGQIQIEDPEGGVLLLTDDGQLWTIESEQVGQRTSDKVPFKPVGKKEVQRRLISEMPAGFQIHTTAHYVLCHNTPKAYIHWVASLFERLHRGFYSYWKNLGWKLPESEFPLVGLVFADREGFTRYSKAELGIPADGLIGYYNLQSNRMITYFLPDRERNIATIIHEATHQLAYNSGLQQRYADNPMWVSEGLAVFFEAPDYRNARGWRTIGRVNQVNLNRFRSFLKRRPADSLASLLTDDLRFRNSQSQIDAYAESWALNYFLLKTRRDAYVSYLKRLSKGKPLETRSRRERIEMLESELGMNLKTLDRKFIQYTKRLR